MNAPLLKLSGINKSFGPVDVLFVVLWPLDELVGEPEALEDGVPPDEDRVAELETLRTYLEEAVEAVDRAVRATSTAACARARSRARCSRAIG